jgi:hypothetical protein
MHKGGQPNNTNAQKRGAFLRALTLELSQNPEQLRKVVKKLVESATNGEAWAITTLADRLDGKPITGRYMDDIENEGSDEMNYLNLALEDLLATLEKKMGQSK